MKLAWLVKSSHDDDEFEIKFSEPESWYPIVIPIVYQELTTGEPQCSNG